jgi:hypothetical protein
LQITWLCNGHLANEDNIEIFFKFSDQIIWLCNGDCTWLCNGDFVKEDDIENLEFPFQITWLCNGDFVKEDDRKKSRLEPRAGELNKWTATLTILVRKLSF